MGRERKRKLDGHYEAEDLVSVWIGTFPNERAFNHYIDEAEPSNPDDFPKVPFWDDLGIKWHDHDFQEAIFERRGMPIEKLIAGISWIDSYKLELLKRCDELGISKANSVIALYEYDYPQHASFAATKLTFVGSFQYSTGGRPFRRNAT